ncbi:MAG: diguanylate phosphodiesterase, partial [Burkholderiales bacterium PBB5]
MESGQLYAVFQPIVALEAVELFAHEALIRGPVGTDLHTPDALLGAAAAEGLGYALEYACVVAALRTWGQLQAPGRIFVNISANALTHWFEDQGPQSLLALLRDLKISPRMLVLEITEHERVADMDHLAGIVQRIRSVGVALALDDFGDGRSSLRLWSQLRPEFVKIDKYFTRAISAHADKLKTLQALQQIAAIFGTELVAEGIETSEDLRVLRDLGIELGQGYFLGHPDRQPMRHVEAQAYRVLRERHIAVLPELSRAVAHGQLRHIALLDAPTVTSHTSNDALAELFLAHTELHAVAVTEGDRPTGLINRAQFMNQYSKLYYREVWRRKPCAAHIKRAPRVIERNHSVAALIGIL